MEDEVEIIFPIYFWVDGTPVSQQGSGKSKSAWKERVTGASYNPVPAYKWTTDEEVSVTIYDFPEADTEGDVDNIVKPILDALCRRVYSDDRQVKRVTAHRFLPEEIEVIEDKPLLQMALPTARPSLFVFVKLNPLEDAK